MPILDLQRQQTEVGRIRIGDTKETVKNGRTVTFPVKRETFGFTTASRALADQVAALYGGAVTEWEPLNGGPKQWEVISDAKALPVIVPPNALSQWYEMWSGGGCVRRCDGQRNVLTDVPCECPADPEDRLPLAAAGKACKPTTRLSLMLADVPGIGVWRLETHGYYAATELPAVAELLAAGGGYIKGRLELQERSAKRPKTNGQGTETRRWMVPTLHVDAAPAELIAGGGRIAVASGDAARAALTAGEQKALPAVPAEPEPPATESRGPRTATEYKAIADEATDLATVQAAWRDAKADGILTDDLASYLRKSGDALAPKDVAPPAPETPAEPPVDGEPEPDPDAAWLAIVSAAGERGWSTPQLEEKLATAMGRSSDECNGWQLAEFLEALKNGQVA